MILPEKLNILGTEYNVLYFNKSSDVDTHGKEPLWGQFIREDRQIRIMSGSRSTIEILQTIIHEMIHAILEDMRTDAWDGEQGHKELDLFATIFVDTITRNGLIDSG